MDAKRRPPPIPEKIVAGMPPAKPPVPMPTPHNQLGSQSKEEGEEAPRKADLGENGDSQRFDPPVGGQFTSPAVALMDPMKKQARRKNQNAVGKSASNGGVSDGVQQVQPTSSQKHLRSPSVKRAPGATVTMQGWLHKQGSEGLMLWKRRWFVLSEFCLFYYKGPEEDKMLGSILLPSYIISPCSSDEPKRGSQRRFSFKAEHHNMRTYYFAAESSESMERWMHNMNLASLLQRDFGAVSEGASWDERQSGRPSISSFSSLLNQSADDSDSGFHGGRSPKHATIAVGSASTGQSAVVPMWAAKGTKLEEETLSEVSRERDVNYRKGTASEAPSLSAEFQPLYANAPPKPRRLNSGGRDYSTSPERSPERKTAEDGVVLRSKVPQQNGMYVERTSRPTVSYASIRHERNSSYQQQTMQVQQQPIGIPGPNQAGIVDRRTPDTYGRSNTAENPTTAVIPKMVPNKVDYEDVYSVNQTGEQVPGRMNRWSSGPYENQHFYHTEIHQNSMQQVAPHMHLFPPSSGPQQTHPMGVVQRMPHPYSVSPTTAQHQHPPLSNAHVQPQMLQRRTPPIPRPHSADFLSLYDHNQMSYVTPLPPIQQPSPSAVDESQKPYKNVPVVEMREASEVIQRPKSSMDIRPVSQTLSFDPVDYWSEESYARMMRQSLYMHAHHVHPSSSSSHKSWETSSAMGHQQLQAPYMQEATPALTHQSTPRLPQVSPKAAEAAVPPKVVEDMAATIPMRQSAPPGKRDLNQGGYFLRSASARMPRSRYHSGDSQREQPNVLSTIPGEEEKNGEKKLQQREESMRRLLEWKQRMLQSPLTRKTSSSNSPRRQVQDTAPQNSSQLSSSHYKQMVLKQLANQEAQASSTSDQSARRGNRRAPDDIRAARSRSHDGRRSSASLTRYNSYSSDDEEALGDWRKRVRRCPQAGKGRRGVGDETPIKNPSVIAPILPQHHHHHHQKLPSLNKNSEFRVLPSSSNHSRSNNHHDRGSSEGQKSPLSAEEIHLISEGGGIPPDASYADVEASGHCDDWHSSRWDQSAISHPLPNSEKRLQFEDEICRKGREIRASSRISNDSKHLTDVNDSVGQLLPEKLSTKQSINAGFVWSDRQGSYDGKDNKKRADIKEALEKNNTESYITAHESGNHEDGGASKLKSWKTPLELRSKRENPPKNIVQNRIKEFEPRDLESKESKKQQLLPQPSPEMKEPLDPSPSAYKTNEAYIQHLRSKGAISIDMELGERDEDISKPFDMIRGGGATADIESSDEGTSSPPPPLPTSSPPSLPEQKQPTATILETASYKATSNAKSVKELLADFERKSEQKKKLMEEENAWEGLSNVGKGRREEERFLPGRRYVFSDTETLLYDTGSDLDEDSESKPWKTRKEETTGASSRDQRVKEEVKEMEDAIPSRGVAEEGDSEVESALNKRTRFGGADSSTEHQEQGKSNASQGSSKAVVEANETMEVITTPGYLRLSLAESLVTHEDLSSANVTPPLPVTKNPVDEEEHYMPMTPSSKSLLASPSPLHSKGASPTSASHSIIMESVFGSNGPFWTQVDAEEESSYVEMTEDGLVKSLLVSETLSSSLTPFSIFSPPFGRNNMELCRKNSGESTATYAIPESPSYTEIPAGGIFESALGRNPTSHYELLSRASTQYEPVYMEVRSVKEGANQGAEETNRLCIKNANPDASRTVADEEKKKKTSEDSFSRGDEFPERKSTYPSESCRLGGMLPDILSNSSTANQRRSLEEEIGSESSDVGDEEDDADDEASKDLDSLDAPRHPRFSLSDTFRPASYYLGASDRTFPVGGAGKGGGDSGSGLMNVVGGGVDASGNELQGDSSDSDLVSPPPIPTSPPPPLDDDEDVLAESVEDSDDKKLSAKTLPNAHLQGVCKNPMQRSVPTSVQPDGSSLSDVSDTASTVCSLRRRPVTGNILDSLINSAPNKSDIPSELYRRRNEILNEYGDYKRGMDFDTPLSPSLPPELWPRPEDGLPSAGALHRRIASADDAAVLYENVHVIMKPRNQTDAMRPPHRSTTPKTPESSQMNVGRVKSPESVKMSNHVRGSSYDGEMQGAPYYYSDLLRDAREESEFFRTASERVARNMHPASSSWRHGRMPLNNQRDDLTEIAAKRNDVGRKVNRIQPPIEPLHIAAFRNQRVEHAPDFPRDCGEGVEKFTAADLLLIGADKRVDFDERNIYETDTLKKAGRMRVSKDQQWDGTSQPVQGPPMHRRCYTPDSLLDSRVTRNIYPYGLMDKSNDSEVSGGTSDTHFSQQNGFQERANRWRRRSRSLEGLLDDDNDSLFVSGGNTTNLTSPPFHNVEHNTWDRSRTTSGTNIENSQNSSSQDPPIITANANFNGADPWSEDNLWRESLRRVSLRHTRSLDHLDDCSGPASNPSTASGRRSVDLLAASDGARKSKVSRGVTYVNERVARRRVDRYHPKDERRATDGQTPTAEHFLGEDAPPGEEPGFEIDREKLRQWDLMSSAPLAAGKVAGGRRGAGGLPRADETVARAEGEQQQESAASGSGSIREPAPIRHSKNDQSSTMLVISQPMSIPVQSPTYVQPAAPRFPQYEGEADGKQRQWRANEGMMRWDNIPAIRKPEDPLVTDRDFHSMQRNVNVHMSQEKKVRKERGEVSVSAGDLLGRTHEELVLLLIQLRRQSAAVSNAIDLCQADLTAQARLAELEMHRRVEHLKKLEELKKHLLELEKQYEKGKPLINLVDNMVKLGSLYRGNTDAQGRIRRGSGAETSPAKDRLQFNQRVQEQRLLAEERRDWSRLSPDHGELQAKVQQLYKLDRLLQEESVTIQSLQQDKELLEKALGGLRHKLQGTGVASIGSAGTTPRDLNSTKGLVGGAVDPVEAERYRKQQRMLERELSRVRQLLAQNSKKLEETVAENARLEQELVILRQKLQLSRRSVDNHSSAQSPGSTGANPIAPSGATASLEAELRRVQSAVGDLQRQRQELSVQVRQLTEKSHSLVEQIRPGPTGIAGAGPIPAKKRHHSTWMETDLDSMESVDCGIESPGGGPSPSRGAPILQPMVHPPTESTPLYVNTALGQHVEDSNRKCTGEEQPSMPNGYEIGEEVQGYQAMDINEADDRMKRFYGIIPREKPEIKTVRIVKRESERRHRDRSNKRVVLVDDPSENPLSTSSLNRVLEEEAVEGEEDYQQQSSHNMSSSVPFSSAFLGPPEEDPILSQFFQRSLSLPRALGKQPPPPPPLRVASPRGSTAAVRRQQLRLRSERPRSAHEQLFGTTQEEAPCLQQPSFSYSVLPSYSSSPSPTLFDPPTPIAYKSEAAREIALEMAALHSGENWPNGDGLKKRATPKEKRRHYTVSCSRPLDLESIVLPKMGSARSRDDLDMEQVLRPRLNAPDVVRSTMSHRDFKYNEHTIDSVLGTPNKIVIPERYIPEQTPELSEEEQMHRLKKAEAIRKMLSETTPITAPEVEDNQQKKPSIIKKKVAEEKRQRDHILQLNQILAKQVMEKSKMVAVRALATLPLHETSTDDDDLSSPVQPLPLTQQRDNFFS